jgi:hypothetical protein
VELTLDVCASTARMCVTAQIAVPGCERSSRFSVGLRRPKHRYTVVAEDLDAKRRRYNNRKEVPAQDGIQEQKVSKTGYVRQPGTEDRFCLWW